MMSEWSVALEMQVALWQRCRRYRNYEEMRREAWTIHDANGEEVSPRVVGRPSAFMEHASYLLLQLGPPDVAPYYFSGPVCQLLKQGSGAYPLDSTLPPADMFFSSSGFWYFAEPIAHIENGAVIRAIIWTRQVIGGESVILFAACLDNPEDVVLLPGFFGYWPNGETIRGAVGAIAPPGTDLVSGDVEYATQATTALQVVLQYFGSAIAFCHQRIFLDSRERADRATRRRAQATGLAETPDVHVITLRRAVPKEGEGAREVEWAWRWWVRGHWRQQAVGIGRAERTPVWIAPYVKGPDDRPMKPSGPDVFLVTR